MLWTGRRTQAAFPAPSVGYPPLLGLSVHGQRTIGAFLRAQAAEYTALGGVQPLYAALCPYGAVGQVMDVQPRSIAYRIDDGRCAGHHRALRNALGAVGPGRFALFDKIRLQTGHFRGPEGPVTVQAAVPQLPCRVKG